VLVSVPTFIFMGVVMERSGIANDLLYCVQVLLKRVPGALALGVTIMGTILAAMTGIIGASVTMMTALALPTMIRQGYAHLYLIFIFLFSWARPSVAPPLPPDLLKVPKGKMLPLLWRAFFPPVVLIGMIKCSILLGWAAPSEAGAVGAFGALLLAFIAGRLNVPMLSETCQTAARTIAMVFFIIISATCFAYVYRALGGDYIVEELIRAAGLSDWGLLILIMAIVFALGFFLDWIEITLIVLPVFAPMIAGLDFGDHVAKGDIVYWFAILMAVNLQTSFLTPPFGFALFYLKGIAPKEVKIESIYLGIIPFVLLQLTGLVIVIAYPNLALSLMRGAYG
jgi:tripartite ATP-independent transporter DctM subunit